MEVLRLKSESLFAAYWTTGRVLLRIRSRSQFLIYFSLVSATDKIILWRCIFEARSSFISSFGVLAVRRGRALTSSHTEYLGLGRVTCLLERVGAGRCVDGLIWCRTLSYASARALEFGATLPKTCPTTRAGLGILIADWITKF